jgi:hypothetical protein
MPKTGQFLISGAGPSLSLGSNGFAAALWSFQPSAWMLVMTAFSTSSTATALFSWEGQSVSAAAATAADCRLQCTSTQSAADCTLRSKLLPALVANTIFSKWMRCRSG